MLIVERVEQMQERASDLKRAGKTLGFVPTMGYLHAGHISLLRAARRRADIVVASIFVNPTQFGPDEDLESYPRDFERDEKICAGEGVDIVFYPSVDEMYPPDFSVYLDEKSLSQGLCGRSRPNHFQGVCTVVAKLFNIIQPDLAVFGQKDYQQLRVIERMVRDLNFPIEVLPGPIVREEDGLAISSRNKYLDPEERCQALCLRRALDLAEELYADGERDPGTMQEAIRRKIEDFPLAKIDYIEVLDAETLASIDRIRQPTLVALAVFIGKTRLIDNTILNSATGQPDSLL